MVKDMKMIRRSVIYILVLCMVLTSMMLGSCQRLQTASEVCNSFMIAMERNDFEAAHSLIWKRSGRVSKDNFISMCGNIIKTLGITRISFPSYEITENGNSITFSYTIRYEKSDEFSFTNSAKLQVVKEGSSYYIQYSKDMLIPDYEPASKIVRSVLKGERGEIFTSDRTAVAVNDYSDTVAIKVSADLDVNTTINSLSTLLELTDKEAAKIRESYNTALEREYGEVSAYVFPKGSVTEELKTQLESIEGVFIDYKLTPQRYYPYREVYAHVVGYTSKPNEDELKTLKEKGFDDAEIIGRYGIEAAYDDYLQPKSGYAYRLYRPDGSYNYTIYEQPAVDGADIFLTIDHQRQQKTYYLMASKLASNQTGATVEMDPSNGYVSVLISMPSFDPNIFSFPVPTDTYNQLIEDERSPLYNKATLGLYPPGSTIKPFVATPALEKGLITKYSVFPYKIVKNTWKPDEVWPWEPITRTETPDNELNMETAFRYSDNIYFSWVALMTGEETFLKYMESIGIGKAVPFDLPTSRSNLLNANTQMDRKMLADLAIGHGEMLITPVQAASMYSCMRNNGDMLVPKLVEKIARYDKNDAEDVLYQAEKEVYIKGVMKPETVRTLTPALIAVVNSGTARSLKKDDVVIAAKTGTALKGDKKNTKVAWVAAWYVDSDEEKLVVVMTEGNRYQPDHRHDVAKVLLEKSESM